MAALGFRVIHETMIMSNAEMIVMGTTGIKPQTAVPPGVRDKISMPAIDQTTIGGPGGGVGIVY